MIRFFMFLALLAFNYFFSFQSLADTDYHNKGLYIGIGANGGRGNVAPLQYEQAAAGTQDRESMMNGCIQKCENALKHRKDGANISCQGFCNDSINSFYQNSAATNACLNRCESEKSSGVIKNMAARNCYSECGVGKADSVGNYKNITYDAKAATDFHGCEKSSDEQLITCPFGQYKKTQTVIDNGRGVTIKGFSDSHKQGQPASLHGGSQK